MADSGTQDLLDSLINRSNTDDVTAQDTTGHLNTPATEVSSKCNIKRRTSLF